MLWWLVSVLLRPPVGALGPQIGILPHMISVKDSEIGMPRRVCCTYDDVCCTTELVLGRAGSETTNTHWRAVVVCSWHVRAAGEEAQK